MTVHRVWQPAGLQPHRLKRYVASTDPRSSRRPPTSLACILNPPERAVALHVDENTAIQARAVTLCRAECRHRGSRGDDGRSPHRYGIHRVSRACHRDQSKQREIHLILDNFSAHKTKAVTTWLDAHPRVHAHFRPRYSSWLNQMELRFARIEQDCIARGMFTSTICAAHCCNTFARITDTVIRSAGATQIPRAASERAEIQLQSTR
jgi:DDE superfamily endonuclease